MERSSTIPEKTTINVTLALPPGDLSVARHIAKKLHKSLEEYLAERATMSLPADVEDIYSPKSPMYKRLMNRLGCRLGAGSRAPARRNKRLMPSMVASAQSPRSKTF